MVYLYKAEESRALPSMLPFGDVFQLDQDEIRVDGGTCSHSPGTSLSLSGYGMLCCLKHLEDVVRDKGGRSNLGETRPDTTEGEGLEGRTIGGREEADLFVCHVLVDVQLFGEGRREIRSPFAIHHHGYTGSQQIQHGVVPPGHSSPPQLDHRGIGGGRGYLCIAKLVEESVHLWVPPLHDLGNGGMEPGGNARHQDQSLLGSPGDQPVQGGIAHNHDQPAHNCVLPCYFC